METNDDDRDGDELEHESDEVRRYREREARQEVAARVAWFWLFED